MVNYYFYLDYCPYKLEKMYLKYLCTDQLIIHVPDVLGTSWDAFFVCFFFFFPLFEWEYPARDNMLAVCNMATCRCLNDIPSTWMHVPPEIEANA